MTIANPPPFTLNNGVTADATQVMANFNQLVANVNANAAANGANSDITSLTGLTTPLGRTYGGSQIYVGGTSTGAANAQVVATAVPTGFSLFTGAMVVFVSGFNNSGATTLNVAGTGAKNVFRQTSSGAAACVGGEIKSGQVVVAIYDGTQYQLVTDALLVNALLSSFAGLTVVAGNLIYGSGASALAVLAPGTSGNILQSGGTGAPSWTASPTLTTVTAATINATTVFQRSGTSIPRQRRGVSSAKAMTVSTVQAQAHSLGVTPTIFGAYMVANTLDLGYAVGSTISLDGLATAADNRGISVWADATNVSASIGSASLAIIPAAGGAPNNITTSRWDLYLWWEYV